jgi:MFS transporter, Spinster family, sphingosine-1-phosphate transporter
LIAQITNDSKSTAAWGRTALILLTALNFANYIDRSVLFAVQPLVQEEFPGGDMSVFGWTWHFSGTDAKFGILTSAFFLCYMVTAPFVGLLADRINRRTIMVVGALIWSAATLLTAVTHSFETLFIRHTIVGIGEATFVTIAPAFLSDMFPEHRRGRVLSIFYLAIPAGTAIGYLLGGYLGHHYGWRNPFLVGATPGFLLAILLMFVPEPRRGAADQLKETVERSTLLGLTRNGAFWTCSLGMAMMTFAVGGMQVWMPTFLARVRNVPLDKANLIFGSLTLISGIFATLLGGWLGDRYISRHKGSYYLVSGIGMALALPAILCAVFFTGWPMYPAIFLGEFFLLLNTAPLNAALVNSVSASIRATAVAVNLFTIHILGDAFSPTLMGYISDKSNLQWSFVAASVAVALSAIILFVGMRFAPEIPAGNHAWSSNGDGA